MALTGMNQHFFKPGPSRLQELTCLCMHCSLFNTFMSMNCMIVLQLLFTAERNWELLILCSFVPLSVHPQTKVECIHSSPKETQLFWSCLSFWEECRSMKFWPKINCTILLIPICKKPHSKIPHRSHTVIRHQSASHCSNFTKLNASSKFKSCLSFWEECMKSGVIQHFHNITWQQYAKDPIQKLLIVISRS